MKRASVACLALAATSIAWASYGQMRLDGIVFVLAVIALSFWGVLLVFALLVGLGRYKAFAAIATVLTIALTVLLLFAWDDGRATMRPRPLTGPAMYVVLTLAAIPVLLAAPFLKLAGKGRPVLLAALAVTLAPAGSIAYSMLRDVVGERVMERARALAPGQIGAFVEPSLRKGAGAWGAPFLWNDQEQAKWIIIGLNRTAMVDRPEPLAPGDAQAIASLVASAAGTRNDMYTGKLEGKLVWDRLLRAAPAERPSVAAALSPQEARQFKEYIVMPHADWLCAPLAEPPTEQAFVRVAALQHVNDRPEFAAKILEKCGRALPVAPRQPS